MMQLVFYDKGMSQARNFALATPMVRYNRCDNKCIVRRKKCIANGVGRGASRQVFCTTMDEIYFISLMPGNET